VINRKEYINILKEQKAIFSSVSEIKRYAKHLYIFLKSEFVTFNMNYLVNIYFNDDAAVFQFGVTKKDTEDNPRVISVEYEYLNDKVLIDLDYIINPY